MQTRSLNSSPSGSRHWKRALLASTCLGGATMSQAQVVNTETTDYSNTFVGATSVSVGATSTTVNGTVTSVTDSDDFILFSTLLPGAAFTAILTGSPLPNSFYGIFDIVNSSNQHVGSPAAPSGNASAPLTFTGTVPNDGKLVAHVAFSEGNPYSISLTANSSVPEPEETTLAVLGAAGAAGIALSRLRRSQNSK